MQLAKEIWSGDPAGSQLTKETALFGSHTHMNLIRRPEFADVQDWSGKDMQNAQGPGGATPCMKPVPACSERDSLLPNYRMAWPSMMDSNLLHQ